MVSKVFRSILIFSLSIILFECSFDNKTGIWNESEKEKKRLSVIEKEQKKNIDTVKLYSSEGLYNEEIHTVKNIVLSEPKKNLSWKMSGMNLQNFFGHIYISGVENIFLKKK